MLDRAAAGGGAAGAPPGEGLLREPRRLLGAPLHGGGASWTQLGLKSAGDLLAGGRRPGPLRLTAPRRLVRAILANARNRRRRQRKRPEVPRFPAARPDVPCSEESDGKREILFTMKAGIVLCTDASE